MLLFLTVFNSQVRLKSRAYGTATVACGIKNLNINEPLYSNCRWHFFLALQYGPMAYPLVGTCILYPIGLDDSDSSDEQSSHAGNDFCEFLVNVYATS